MLLWLISTFQKNFRRYRFAREELTYPASGLQKEENRSGRFWEYDYAFCLFLPALYEPDFMER
jgi:hypothetical protein